MQPGLCGLCQTPSQTRNHTYPFSPLLHLVPDIVLVSLGILNLILFFSLMGSLALFPIQF